MKVLVLGGISYDTKITIDKIDNFKMDMFAYAKDIYAGLGSTGVGKALALDAINIDTTFMGLIGIDEIGNKVIDDFRKTNVQFIPLLDCGDTETHLNVMHGDSGRLSIVTSKPCYNFDVDEALLTRKINESDYIFLNITYDQTKIIHLLNSVNKKIVVDIHDYDGQEEYHKQFIDKADIIIMSDVNIDDPHTFAKEMIVKGKELVVITSADKGSYAYDNEMNYYEHKGYKLNKVLDSNGAGDSFSVGFLYGYNLTEKVLDALKYGNYMGSRTCTVKSISYYNYKFDENNILIIEDN